MDQNGEVQAASAFSNNTSSSVFYCWTHGPGMAFDLHETTSPLTFAAFATIAAPIAFLLNTLTILAVKQKKELRQRLSSVLLSSMAVVHLLTGGICIPLSAIVALLLPYRIVAVQHFCLMNLVTSILTFSLAICSLIHLTMIAWERYISIRKWIDYKTIVTRSRLRKMTISAWLIWVVALSSVFIILPIAVGQDKTVMDLALTIFATGNARCFSLYPGSDCVFLYHDIPWSSKTQAKSDSPSRRFGTSKTRKQNCPDDCFRYDCANSFFRPDCDCRNTGKSLSTPWYTYCVKDFGLISFFQS